MDELASAEVLIAGEDGSVSHRQLFETATEYHFGQRAPAPLRAGLARRAGHGA